MRSESPLDVLMGEIVTAALKVHSALGPGLLERAYVVCLAHELRKQGHEVRTEVPLRLVYDGVNVGLVYRMDLLVDDLIVVEAKAIEKLAPIHAAQLLSHLRIGGYRLGLLLNFHALRLRDGMKRVIASS